MAMNTNDKVLLTAGAVLAAAATAGLIAAFTSKKTATAGGRLGYPKKKKLGCGVCGR